MLSTYIMYKGAPGHHLLCWTNAVGAKADKFSEIFQQLLKLPYICKADISVNMEERL